MGYMTEGYKILFKGIADWIVRNRAHIGTGVSIGGTIVSNVLSTRAGAKSGRMIDAKSQELARPLTTKEKVELCWKNHVGSAATAGVACVGAAYSDNQHVKDFNKAMTAYTGIKKLYDTTRRATKEVLGEKKEMELQDKINQKTIANDPEEGAIYKGVVTRLMSFGVFVEIAPGKEGMVHISKIANARINRVEDVLQIQMLMINVEKEFVSSKIQIMQKIVLELLMFRDIK